MNKVSFGIRDKLNKNGKNNNIVTDDLKVLYSVKENSSEYSFGNTLFYYYKKDNVIIRFDTADLLLWEQRHKDQRFNHNGDLK